MKFRDYILHTRPQSYPLTFFAVLTGYALSPEKPMGLWAVMADLLLLFLIFSILLWGGTNAFNTGQDGEEGPLTMLPEPPPVPKHLSAFGLILKILAVGLASFISVRLMLFTALGAVLSTWYSWKNPWFKRGKDIPFIDMLINTAGFGFCSILFGFMLTPAALHSGLFLIGIGFTLAYQGGMPTTQIFQLKGGEQNYTAMIGPGRVLKLGSLFFLLHLVFIATAQMDELRSINDPLSTGCIIGWFLLVVTAAIHSFYWSYSPMKNAYKMMNRQMILMMGSQLLWTVFAWRIS